MIARSPDCETALRDQSAMLPWWIKFKVTKHQITKIDAARRQLEAAIKLFFHEGDPVAIHTLVRAAVGIIDPIQKLHGKIGPITSTEELFEQYVKDEYLQSVRKKHRTPQNFFKHADKDPDAILNFDSSVIELELFFAINGYQSITGDVTALMMLMRTWIYQSMPGMFKHEREARLFAMASMSIRAFGWRKSEFFDQLLPTMVRIRSDTT